VNEEAFIVISSLATMFKENIQTNIEKFYEYIDFGLQ